MKIDRKRAEVAFQSYVEAYNVQDEKVRLKIEHTYRVSALCDEIAKSLGLSEEDVDLAWLIGLLHDVGRFEQLKNYGTFIDDLSINHAEYGAEILFSQGKIRDYIEDTLEDETIFTAVNCHNAYRIPDKLEARTEMFCHIIRDADKIDILKVNVDFPLEEIYNVTSEELRSGQVTEEVLECFEEEKAVYRKLKTTAVDNVVGHISLVYELVYPVSLELVEKQGYLEKLMNFDSDNPVTERQFERIRGKMREYVAGKNGDKAVEEK
ncbi:putative nucleotidyltransferase with HDIG domain [Kineothrix alysoides]|uniref:Putative nucleotidyltransferase with HDIG domain n=1 Tax=Kineothrix alysoides TaxID=1469948 RepID=A0A4R1R6K3_9FIRM|nr:HD domain-containing protein [Kineothrix alysoides]TCL61130.1 putative nucleotidyltransferase with HDIG domain [Kineothrix alysoides]